jgi:hypothetical protein
MTCPHCGSHFRAPLPQKVIALALVVVVILGIAALVTVLIQGL